MKLISTSKRMCRAQILQDAPPEQRSDLNLLNLCSWGPCLAALAVAPLLEHPWPASAQHGRSTSTHGQREPSAWEPKFGGINPKASSRGGACFADSEHKAVENLHPKWDARCSWDACGSRAADAQTQGTRLVSSTSSPRPSVAQLCQPKRAVPWVKQGRKGFVAALQALQQH